MLKNKQAHQAHGQLGRIFQFTQDDLAANRAGYMTLAQQFAFKFWERKVYAWVLHLPPFKWFLSNRRREAKKITGKVKKHYHSKIIFTGSGGPGGGHQEVLEQRRIELDSLNGVATFYVRENQYNALPENVEMTIYYDAMENRILSVESPYAEEQRT